MTTMATETATRRQTYGHVPPVQPMGGSGAQRVGRQVQTQRETAMRQQARQAQQRRQARTRTIRAAAPTTPIHRSNYQAIILVEFVAAILLTAATPIASKKNQTGLSPYAASDMVQLAALTLLYFILALVSVGGGNAARLSAWFGGLILIGVGLGEAATIATTLDVFGTTAGGSNAAGVAQGSAGLINPNAPSTSPAQPTPATSPNTGVPTVGGIT